MTTEAVSVASATMSPLETGDTGLTPGEQRHLTSLEKRIERGLSTFREVGEALLDIRDNRLFRATHPTFESYCRERWDIDRGRAYQLMGAAEVAQALPTGKHRLVNEAQARELVPLLHTDPAKFTEVWQTIAESQGPLTAPVIREAVRTALGTEPEPKAPDTTTGALLALLDRATVEYRKWKLSKPNIGERTKVKAAMDRLIDLTAH